MISQTNYSSCNNKVFFFQPIFKKTIWGGEHICPFKHISNAAKQIGECWEISGVEGNETLVLGGEDDGKSLAQLIEKYGAALMGKKNMERYGTSFPLLIKYISAFSDLSVQVHPDDAMAQRMGHPFGKTEMWYIVDADKGAQLISGFSKKISPETYEVSAENGTIVDALAYHNTHPGDVFFTPAGRIHAIGGGNFILEIQQSSNDTFRVYDYKRTDDLGQLRPLHIEQAKEALNFDDLAAEKVPYQLPADSIVPVVECEAFVTQILQAHHTLRVDLSAFDSFSIFSAFQGAAQCTTNAGVDFTLESGMTVLLPAATQWVEIHPSSEFKCAEVHIAE